MNMKPIRDTVVVLVLALSLVGAFSQAFLLQSGPAEAAGMFMSPLKEVAAVTVINVVSVVNETHGNQENKTSPITYEIQGGPLKCISPNSCTNEEPPTPSSTQPKSSSSLPQSSPSPTQTATLPFPAKEELYGVIIPFPLAITAFILVLVLML